jgi:hypothetical protein
MANISDGNYTGLVDSCQAWLHRSDVLDADVDNCIYLFEADFNAQMETIEMESFTTIGITNGYLTNPTDWREWKSIILVQGNYREPLLPLTRENAAMDYGYSYNQRPRGYVPTVTKTYIYPAPGSGSYTYETTYNLKLPGLSVSNTTNWLLTKFPHVYLQGVLFWASDFITDDQRLAKYQAMVTNTLSQIEAASNRSRLNGGIASMRPDRVA